MAVVQWRKCQILPVWCFLTTVGVGIAMLGMTQALHGPEQLFDHVQAIYLNECVLEFLLRIDCTGASLFYVSLTLRVPLAQDLGH